MSPLKKKWTHFIFLEILFILVWKGWCVMKNKPDAQVSKKTTNTLSNKNMNNARNAYDDGNIPEVDLPRNSNSCKGDCVEPLPESSRPRQDGPGGN